jgi:hypothetical protein
VPEVDHKPLPKGLKYEFLGPDKTYPVTVSDESSPEENEKLLILLKKHRKVIVYSINDLKGLSSAFCTHRIPMEDQCKPVVDHQRRLTHAMREVVKKEVIKLLDAEITLIFAFSMGTRGSCKFPFTWMINRKQHLHALMECLHT